MRAQIIGSLAALLLVAALVVPTDAICEHFGKQCSQDSPCCFNGYCDSKPSFCGVGCDPTNSFSTTSCYPKPACVNFQSTFSDPKKIINAADYDANPNEHDWTSDFLPDNAKITGDNGLELDMHYNGTTKNEVGNYEGFGATVTWTRLLEYGKVTAVLKTASVSPGVVSSFITRSPEGDEIDFEWVGKDPTEVQSNFYYNNELDYTKGAHHSVGADTSKDYHEYAIEWMPDHITWWIDGKSVRTVQRDSTKQTNGTYKFPDKMSRVQFSIWDGGMKAKGTADWAGTPTDWSDQNRVYSLFVKSIKVECLYPNQTSSWPPAGYGPNPKGTANPQGPYAGGSGNGSAATFSATAPLALVAGLVAVASAAFL